MTDHLIRATIPGVRIFAAVTTDLVEEARRRHHCYPVAAAALGRTMTAAVLLAATLKTNESLTIRINGGGPLGDIMADAQASGTVRGYVKNPQVDIPLRGSKLDVGGAVGKNGYTYVTRFTGLKQPFTGSAPLVSGEIAEDITNYLTVSEQTPSSVALGVLINPDLTVQAAGGFMIQALPNAEDSLLVKIEQKISLLPPLSQIINEGRNAAGIIEFLFSDFPYSLYDEVPLQFYCSCSYERVEKVLISLGIKELTSMAEEESTEVCCQFCNEKYVFTSEELKTLIKLTDSNRTSNK